MRRHAGSEWHGIQSSFVNYAGTTILVVHISLRFARNGTDGMDRAIRYGLLGKKVRAFQILFADHLPNLLHRLENSRPVKSLGLAPFAKASARSARSRSSSLTSSA